MNRTIFHAKKSEVFHVERVMQRLQASNGPRTFSVENLLPRISSINYALQTMSSEVHRLIFRLHRSNGFPEQVLLPKRHQALRVLHLFPSCRMHPIRSNALDAFDSEALERIAHKATLIRVGPILIGALFLQSCRGCSITNVALTCRPPEEGICFGLKLSGFLNH